jgi:integrase
MAANSLAGKFLQRRGLSWYVRVRVPPSLQKFYSNTHVRRALNTKDKREAERRKLAVVAAIKAEFERLRKDPTATKLPARSKGDPRAWAESIRSLRAEGDHEQADTVELVASDYAERIEQREGLAAAKRWHAAATTASLSLDEYLEVWLAATDYTEQTKNTYRRAYRDLKEGMLGLGAEDSLFPADITDSVAVRFAAQHLPQQGYSAKSIGIRLGALSSLWAYLQQQQAAPLGRNPWKGHKLSPRLRQVVEGPKARKSPEDERAFTDGELVALLQGTERARQWDVYPRVRDLMLLGLYTGARLNELASLLVRDVTFEQDEKHGAYALLSLVDGKKRGQRRTAVVTHWAALQVLQRRIVGKPSRDAQVFEELTPGGPDGKLSWTVSKAFTRYRRECGVPDGTDFHSLRRTFITLMEHKRVDYVAVCRFVGHTVQTMMHAVYSAGASPEGLLGVAQAAVYAPEVERAVAALAATSA